MIMLIGGASHTGKTNLAQKLLEKYQFPYLSIDHLKMGLIRSGLINVSVDEDEKITLYLWPILKEIIKTAIENHQNLIVEGTYIPFDFEESFSEEYKKEIDYVCLVMTKEYIQDHFNDIKIYANVIEKRLDDSYCTYDNLIKENEYNKRMCSRYGHKIVLIDKDYDIDAIINCHFSKIRCNRI